MGGGGAGTGAGVAGVQHQLRGADQAGIVHAVVVGGDQHRVVLGDISEVPGHRAPSGQPGVLAGAVDLGGLEAAWMAEVMADTFRQAMLTSPAGWRQALVFADLTK